MIKQMSILALVAIGIGALFLATPAFAQPPTGTPSSIPGCTGAPQGVSDNPPGPGNPHDVTGTHPGDQGNPHDAASGQPHDVCPGSNVH